MLVSGCTVSVKRFEAERPDRIGVLIVPAGGNRLPNSPTVYAADNGCFTELDTPKFLRMLAGIVRHDHPPLWVSCPDKVADAGETWRLFHRWAPMVREIGLPVAVVLQDGTERLKWRGQLVACSDMYDAVFVGGSTEFKLSPEAFRLTRDAHDAGKLVHFGRVNSITVPEGEGCSRNMIALVVFACEFSTTTLIPLCTLVLPMGTDSGIPILNPLTWVLMKSLPGPDSPVQAR
jgi:hypothetical protein